VARGAEDNGSQPVAGNSFIEEGFAEIQAKRTERLLKGKLLMNALTQAIYNI
jgi:hypothetical protein